MKKKAQTKKGEWKKPIIKTILWMELRKKIQVAADTICFKHGR